MFWCCKTSCFCKIRKLYLSRTNRVLKESTRLTYTPIVNTKAVKPKANEKEKGNRCGVRTAKYPVKSIDYLTSDRHENLQSGRFRKKV